MGWNNDFSYLRRGGAINGPSARFGGKLFATIAISETLRGFPCRHGEPCRFCAHPSEDTIGAIQVASRVRDEHERTPHVSVSSPFLQRPGSRASERVLEPVPSS